MKAIVSGLMFAASGVACMLFYRRHQQSQRRHELTLQRLREACEPAPAPHPEVEERRPIAA
jgi:hypothetical protein